MKLGIQHICSGLIKLTQKRIMFGDSFYDKPKELKFWFISGNNFLKDCKNDIIDNIINGCNIKILLADPKNSIGFLKRAEYLCPQNDGYTYLEQIKEVSSLVSEIANKLIIANKYNGSIEIRYYIDEYRYPVRLALYGNNSSISSIKMWANYQALMMDAVDLSLGVIGSYENNKKSNKMHEIQEDNIAYNLNKAFDAIWDKYCGE